MEGIELAGVLVQSRRRHTLPPGLVVHRSLHELLAVEPAAVVEAAGHDAVREHGEAVLAAGADLVCVSVGALADEALLARLRAAAGGRARILVPSGAIGALDALRALSLAGLDSVEVEQRKPPAAVLGRQEAATLTEPRILFEGTAREAVRRYPRTSNVVAAVALAGVGFERTQARVVADPSATGNEALLRAEGPLGRICFRIENVPTASARTSAVTALSVLATLERLVRSPVIPA